MKFKVGQGTDIGRKRQQNQDAFATLPELGFFMISDGMGGHQGGEIASITSVQSISQSIRESQKNKNWDPSETLNQAIKTANLAIYEKSLSNPNLQGMGTTTTTLLFKDQILTIGHVGDSRCYFFRPNSIWQITRDHSLVQEKLRAGLITRDEAKKDRMKNIITRSVGFEKELHVEIYQMAVQPGDSFLICSDGLSGLVDDSNLLKIVQTELFENENIQKTVDSLIAAANSNGGDDNITSIVVQVSE